ncbi:MAG TPA: hypothetical protein VEG34_18065 [Thermoanaerobaculia bacterium]|nr:hypothetical protein [Thermoanaerobaculia bacterium]
MPSYPQHSSRPPVPPPPPPAPPSLPSIFSPAFLACLHDREDPPTAAEADLSGPWRVDPVPGEPGMRAVLRVWENLEDGDRPRAVFDQEELAELCAAVLPLLGREPFAFLQSGAGARGFPVVAIDGENGPRECGALASTSPSWSTRSTSSRASSAPRPPWRR